LKFLISAATCNCAEGLELGVLKYGFRPSFSHELRKAKKHPKIYQLNSQKKFAKFSVFSCMLQASDCDGKIEVSKYETREN